MLPPRRIFQVRGTEIRSFVFISMRYLNLTFYHLFVITVTLPPGVSSGDVIHVKAPDGRLNAIVIPEGMGPGSTFTVEFGNDDIVPPLNMAPGTFVPTVIAEPEMETGVPAASYTNYNHGAVEQAPPVAQPISAMQMNAAYAPK